MTRVLIKGMQVRANIRGGKTKEIKCKITAGANHMAALALIPPEPAVGVGGRFLGFEPKGHWPAIPESRAPLLFKKKLPFNLFLSFISQVNQHGAG